MLALRQECVKTARVVALLYEDEREVRKDLFFKLHEAADRGLRGPHANVEDGRDNLNEVREAIADSAIGIRDQRLRQYSWLAMLYGVVPLLVGVAIVLTRGFGYLAKAAAATPVDPLYTWVLAALWIPGGRSHLVWGEFALRMQAGLSYEQL